MGEIKQTNFRLNEEDASHFREFCEENGYNQAEGFEFLMHVLEIEQTKQILANREMEISEFERHTKNILDAYIHSLELCANSEERIREEFNTQLATKDQQIIDYQQKVREIEVALTMGREDVEAAMQENNNLNSQIKELQEKLSMAKNQIDTYKTGNDALTASLQLATEKANKNTQAAEKYQTIVDELRNVRKELEQAHSKITALQDSHKAEIELINHDHIAELRQSEMKGKLDAKDAVERVKQEYQEQLDTCKAQYENKIEQLTENANKRIDMYQDKLERANEKLEQVRREMQNSNRKI